MGALRILRVNLARKREDQREKSGGEERRERKARRCAGRGAEEFVTGCAGVAGSVWSVRIVGGAGIARGARKAEGVRLGTTVRGVGRAGEIRKRLGS